MRKALPALLAAVASFPALADDILTYKVKFGYKPDIILETRLKQPAPYSDLWEKRDNKCSMIDAGTGLSTTVQFPAKTGTHVLVLPLEASDDGVKTLMTFETHNAENLKQVALAEDCEVYTGPQTAQGLTVNARMKWGQPRLFILEDGEEITVSVTRAPAPEPTPTN